MPKQLNTQLFNRMNSDSARREASRLLAEGKVQEADATLTVAIEACTRENDSGSTLGELHVRRAQCRIVLASQSRELERAGFPLQLDHLASWELVLADARAANRLVGGRAALETSAVAVDNLTLLPSSSSGSGSSHDLDSLLHALAADAWAMVVEECGGDAGQRAEKAAARRDEQRSRCGPLSAQDATALVERLLSESASTSPVHAAVEHVVGLTYHRLGCRVPLREWRPYHLGADLRAERIVEAVIEYRLQQGMDGDWSAKGLATGTLCRLHALEARPELNGRLGEVLHYDSSTERYAMAVRPRDAGAEALQCRVQAKNLRPAAAY